MTVYRKHVTVSRLVEYAAMTHAYEEFESELERGGMTVKRMWAYECPYSIGNPIAALTLLAEVSGRHIAKSATLQNVEPAG